jgi:hypothetical protein
MDDSAAKKEPTAKKADDPTAALITGEFRPAEGTMDPERYINERLKQYVGWYNDKAVVMKARYLRMRWISVVSGAVVPVLVNLSFPLVSYLTTALSLVVVVLVSLEGVFHYREQWKNYRSTEQFLGHELFFFRTRGGPYRELGEAEAFQQLVDRVESAIAAENASTLNTMTLAGQVTGEEGKNKFA